MIYHPPQDARDLLRARVEAITGDCDEDEYVLESAPADRNGNGHFIVRYQWIASIVHRFGEKYLYVVPCFPAGIN